MQVRYRYRFLVGLDQTDPLSKLNIQKATITNIAVGRTDFSAGQLRRLV